MSAKLPIAQLNVYLAASQKAQQAIFRMGVIRLEKAELERQTLEDYKKQNAEKDAAVRSGLEALGLNPDDPSRNFFVDLQGGVFELIDGKHVTPKELET